MGFESLGEDFLKPSILLVDDEPDFCAALRDILEAAGFEVHNAPSVSAALTILEGFTPTLILTDVMMPGVDGLTFVRQLRSRADWAKIKTIVVSAKGMPEDIAAARRAGADAYLTKPFSARDLREAVEAFSPPIGGASRDRPSAPHS
jgi:DNA-binding response OmpR family regulator